MGGPRNLDPSRRRTPLFAAERVVAAWLGLTATTLFATVAVVIATLRDRTGPALFTAIGALLLVLAVANLVHARRRRAGLLRRKRELSG